MHQKKNREELLYLLESNQIDKKELIDNLGLFLNTKNFSRILFSMKYIKNF